MNSQCPERAGVVPAGGPRSGNVTRGQAFVPEVIALGEHRPDPGRVIALEDLAVGSDGNHLFLAALQGQRRVLPAPLAWHGPGTRERQGHHDARNRPG